MKHGFFFVIHPENEKLMNSLQLPDESRIMCVYRDGKFKIPDADHIYKIDDEVVILTHCRNLPWLNKLLLMRPEAIDLEVKP